MSTLYALKQAVCQCYHFYPPPLTMPLLKEFYQESITVGNEYNDHFAEVFGARNGTLRDSLSMCLLICAFFLYGLCTCTCVCYWWWASFGIIASLTCKYFIYTCRCNSCFL